MSAQEAREIVCFHDILVRRGSVGLGVKEKYALPYSADHGILLVPADCFVGTDLRAYYRSPSYNFMLPLGLERSGVSMTLSLYTQIRTTSQ